MSILKRTAMLAMAVLLLAGCQYDTLKEAVSKDIPFNKKAIIHTEKKKNGAVVLYTTEQKYNDEKVEALAAAYLSGNEKEGWENTGHNHWIYYENKYMMQYSETFNIYSPEGKLTEKVPVVFGRINSSKVISVEVSESGEKFRKAVIVKKGKNRYYYIFGDYKIARGLDKNGKEISRQGKR
ncbi:hypothetical protein [Bacillus massilinigeriensis]|uniref:hypothetical protein n=1 Tax=Bacillus mediterraneensis TaxID=1805474 RepID=UPI0009F67F63|nr:hypothetical protein [Bacillus mediterraneensis]